VLFCARACARDGLPRTFPGSFAQKAFHRPSSVSFREIYLLAAFSFLEHEEPDRHYCRVQESAIDVPLLEVRHKHDLNRRGCTFKRRAKRLRRRKSKLVFLSGALERFRCALDTVHYLIVFFDWDQSNDLVLAACSVVLKGSREVDKLAE